MYSIAINKQEAYLDILRLFLRQTDIELKLGHFRGPKQGFLVLQQHMDSLYYQKPLEERIEVVTSLAVYSLQNSPEVFKVALARDGIPPQALFLKNTRGETLLHIVAESIGRLAADTTLGFDSFQEYMEANLKGNITQVSR